jgi:formate dehydrogenase subunit gamma
MDALIEPSIRRVAGPARTPDCASAEPALPVASTPHGEAVPVRGEAGAHAIEPASAVLAAEILRFRRSEILVHWAIAVPFMICFVTGFVLKLFFNLDGSVTRATLSWIHRTSGGCLIVGPILVALLHVKDLRLHLDNVKKVWSWTRHDLRWLVFSGLAAAGFKVTLPEQHKFNAGEKINFMILTCTYPLFAVTGLLIWLPGVPIASWILHVTVAAAVAPVMFGHIFMATVNKDTRPGLSGMVSGVVDRTWAKHHYRLWYREHHEAAEVAARAAEREAQPVPVSTGNRGVDSGAGQPVSRPRALRTPEEMKFLECPTGRDAPASGIACAPRVVRATPAPAGPSAAPRAACGDAGAQPVLQPQG